MQISIQTANILDVFGIDEGFRMIAEAGFDGVDFNLDLLLPGQQIVKGECGGFFDQTDEEMTRAMRPYTEAAARCGLSFVQAHAPFPTWVKNDGTNAYVLKALKKTIMLCGYVGCKNLVVHPCIMPDDPRAEWDANMRLYTALIPDLRMHGVTCCLENMFAAHRGRPTEAICSDPHEAVRYIDKLNDAAGERLFGFCLDIGHATLLGKDVYRFVEALGDRLTITHVHDNNGLSDEHLSPYMGITNWDRVCRALKEHGYAGALSLETLNTLATFDRALAPQLLSLMGATARLLADRAQ